ncbi:WYL domain-containing protein [Kamptonema animale CS-326]|uniref:WYL domain-containing protein n=1 Tax=Kamptonema animale TaxID=92934 RepID=UPI00232E1C1E|nr:WYL domain-containing protein [Kamptonema animale]MDB9512837.1 WYL domain-containing protein [Kamptonema animale CS-326]
MEAEHLGKSGLARKNRLDDSKYDRALPTHVYSWFPQPLLMAVQNLNHFLIGPPGSGKSTLARQIAQLDERYVIVSTDSIRKELFGDESIQGNWSQVEAITISSTQRAIATGKLVIYDATNAKRAWRLNWLEKVKAAISEEQAWMGWHLTTPLEICLEWNEERERRVPKPIIVEMANCLKTFPPDPAEGFVAVSNINLADKPCDFQPLQAYIKSINSSIKAHHSRTANYELHPYSCLLDFERLMHLIAIILQYPGIGSLHKTKPQYLEEILGSMPQVDNTIDEICSIISLKKGNVYSNPIAIEADLAWLEANGILRAGNPLAIKANLVWLDTQENSRVRNVSNEKRGISDRAKTDILRTQHQAWHSYSNLEPFQRLLKIIRYIARSPFQIEVNSEEKSKVQCQTQEELTPKPKSKADFDVYYSISSIRRDIEKVLKPYKILPEFCMKRGYFVGTAIFTEGELKKLYELLQSQQIHMNDPVAVEMLQIFQERIEASRLLGFDQIYPTRVIGNHGIVNPESLPQSALVRQLDDLEQAIVQGQLLELSIFPGRGRFTAEHTENFTAYPLQIIFHNIAWYLGYEIKGGKSDGLLRFERLDRLSLENPSDIERSIDSQNPERSNSQREFLDRLIRLYKASAGIYLGDSAEDQRKFLSGDSKERKSVEVTVELWMNDSIFRFVSEGSQRFPRSQMKMSRRFEGEGGEADKDKSLFTLKQTPDPQFPNCFRVKLPYWSLKDIDLKRWILGLGPQVKVVKPTVLVEALLQEVKAIANNYQS